MNGKTILCLISLLAALAFGMAGTALAATTLTVTPAGDGIFLLQGRGVADTAGMDITITYDGNALANPRVVPGDLVSGALTAVNVGIVGTVRIGIIRTAPIHGDGIIATLRFDRKGAAAGGIQMLTASLSNLAGETLPVQLRVAASETSPGFSDQSARDEEKTGTPAPESVAPVAPAHGPVTGVAAGLTTGGRAGEEITEGVKGEEVTAAPEVAPVAEPQRDKAEPPQEILVLASVLDRFRDHRGERSVEAFTALFEQSGVGGFIQTPSPLLADGKNVLEVVFVAAAGDSKVADMTATGARLLSLDPAPDDSQTWVVQLRPERGVSQASLTVPLQTYAIVFPLTVAPKLKIDLDKSGRVTPADFALFLKKRSAFDLNGDGKRDYRDDYLFTANYLVALRGEKKSGGQPPKAR